MNLIVFLDTEQISFFKEENEKVSLISDSFLYFYFDTINNEIKYDINYKMFIIEEKDFFYGDILKKIYKDEKISINDKSYNAYFFISQLIDKELKNLSFDQTSISFSNNLPGELKNKLTEFFKEKFKNLSVIDNFTSLAVKNYLKSNQILNAQKDIFILSTNENNIISTKAEFDGSNIQLKNNQTIKNMAFYPLGYELAKRIFNDIQRIYQPQSSESDLCNTNFIYCRIKDKAEKIVQSQKSHVSVSTRLKNSDERFVVNIKPDEVKVSAKVFLKSFIEKLLSNVKVPKNARLILIGDFFNNQLVFNEIDGYFKNVSKLEFKSVFETRKAEFGQEIDEYSTMFLSEEERLGYEAEETYKQTSTIDITSLQIGVKIKLSNYDSRKGKGYSTQEIEFLGDNKFVVIESTRSLKTGDIAVAEENIWHQGIKLIFNIKRAGKKYGRFQTREIQIIEISE